MTARKKRLNTKKMESELPEYRITINYTEDSYVTREADPDDEWDGNDTRTDYSFQGTFELSKTNYFDFILREPPIPNKEYYLVYVIYSTGDTFHRDDGCMVMIEFLDNYEDAVALRNAIKTDYEKWDKHSYHPSSYSFKMTLPKSGRELTVSTGTWKGYFEHMDRVDIETVSLNENA